MINNVWAFAAGVATMIPFWIVIVLNIVVFGLFVLAIYLTDTPLECFLKNNPLSNRTLLTVSGQPFEFSKKVYSNRNQLVSDKFSQWRNFTKCIEDLYDLLISYKVQYSVAQKGDFSYRDEDYRKSNQMVQWVRDAMQAEDAIYFVKSIVMNCTLRKFIYDESEFYFELLFFPNGFLKEKKYILMKTDGIKLENADGLDKLAIKYTLNNEQSKLLNISSEFLFLSRSVINKNTNENWPGYLRQDYYYGYRFSAIDNMKMPTAVIENMKTFYGLNVRVGTREELLRNKTWELK